MAARRNRSGKIIKGVGAELTEMQSTFIERVAAEGIENAPKISREMGYTNYYRDRRTAGTAFHRELMALVDAEMKSVEAAKGMNLKVLIQIRDNALAAGDMKTAMESIKIINDMQGYKAPTKVEQTKFDIKATIDLTAPEQEDDGYLDIDFEEED
jgi:hypothetical protein